MRDSFNNFSWYKKQKGQKQIVLANKLYCTIGQNVNPPKCCLSSKLYNSLGGNRNNEPPSEKCWRSPMVLMTFPYCLLLTNIHDRPKVKIYLWDLCMNCKNRINRPTPTPPIDYNFEFTCVHNKCCWRFT